MAIDPEKLERVRKHVDALRLEAEKLEAESRTAAARAEAVRLGLRLWCKRDCGRVVTHKSVTGVCQQCQQRECMAKTRARLRLINGRAA